jgi:trimethylamine monooxygenase
MTFRDKSHTSAFTGCISPIHHTAWLDAKDDSMKSYLDTQK